MRETVVAFGTSAPEQRTTIVVLTNRAGRQAREIADDLLDLLLTQFSTTARPGGLKSAAPRAPDQNPERQRGCVASGLCPGRM